MDTLTRFFEEKLAEARGRNAFHEENPAYLGDFVHTINGTDYTGRVYDAHYSCPENDAWLRGQMHLGDNPMAWANVRWVSILVHKGGAIVVPDVLVEKVEPFLLDNNSSGFYFPLSERSF
jgi:hypothetical protein